MPYTVDLVYARLAWAEQHINALKKDSAEFIRSGAFEVTDEARPAGSQVKHTLRIRVHEPIPDELAFRLGDAIHSMRSICDGLYRAAKVNVNIIQSRNHLPVMLNSQSFAEWQSRKGNCQLPASLISVVESIQPYNPTSTVIEGPVVGVRHPLHILHELWNQDKHELPLRPSLLEGWRDTYMDGNFVDYEDFVPNGPVEDGDAIAIYTLDPNDEPGEVKIEYAAGLGFDFAGPGRGLPVNNTLDEMHRFLADTLIPAFAPLM